jgi:nicotinamide-nucleotide amidase
MGARRGRGTVAVEVLGTGDEILRGDSRDSNFARIASRLTAAGFEVAGGRVVGDDLGALVDALRAAAGRARAVIVTGGLGPTPDDLTRDAAAAAAGRRLAVHGPSLRRIRALWRLRGLPMPGGNARQAEVPRGARVIPNPLGSAPGFSLRLGGATAFCLPGPPREMEPMLERSVLPALRRLAPSRPPARTLHASCCGLPESAVAERIADLMARDRAVRVGTTASEGVVTVSVHGAGDAAREAPRVHREVLRRLGAECYAPERVPPGENLVRLLLARGLTAATAESCTAGLAAARMADLPGSSGAFLGGVVAYHDRVKTAALGVPRALLEAHGAVSAPVAEAMARGARRRTGADLAVAITGIAGPGGARPGKPVGLVWFAVASAAGVVSVRRRFGGGRALVRSAAANAALDLLRRTVEGREVR